MGVAGASLPAGRTCCPLSRTARIGLHGYPASAGLCSDIAAALSLAGSYEVTERMLDPERGPSSALAPDVDVILLVSVSFASTLVEHVHVLRRCTPNTPIMVIGSRPNPQQSAALILAGADDFLGMAYHDWDVVAWELMARVWRLARRAVELPETERVVVNPNASSICIDGTHVALLERSFKVLIHLLAHRDRWVRGEGMRKFSKEEFGITHEEGAANARWHILQLRKALGIFSRHVHSDMKLGYMFSLEPCGRTHCRR